MRDERVRALIADRVEIALKGSMPKYFSTKGATIDRYDVPNQTVMTLVTGDKRVFKVTIEGVEAEASDATNGVQELWEECVPNNS